MNRRVTPASAPRHTFLIRSLLAMMLTACACTTESADDDDSGIEAFGEDPSFGHPATWLYAHFDTATNAQLAFTLRALEASIESSVDFSSDELIDQSPSVVPLNSDDLKGLSRPDADPGLCEAVTLAARSSHAVERHATGALQVDQSGGDPSTPEHHERTFSEDTDLCWESMDCDALRAEDAMTRVNALFTIELNEQIDYRWVDLDLPAPSNVLAGEEAINEGLPRWGIVMRSWMPEASGNDSETASFEQAYNLGAWISQDSDPLLPVLRYTASWTQTQLPVPLDESTVRQLTRGAIADAYEAQESWLGTLP
jgi:hypothetical protein